MREILFRGQRFDGVWVEGYFFAKPILEKYFIIIGEDQYMVKPETVGQYTGLTDKNGVKIFEGDVVKVPNDSYFVVCYGEYFPKFYCEAIKDVFGMVPDCMHVGLFGGSIKTGEEVILTNCTHLYEIIGNIHDNPELLKGVE